MGEFVYPNSTKREDHGRVNNAAGNKDLPVFTSGEDDNDELVRESRFPIGKTPKL